MYIRVKFTFVFSIHTYTHQNTSKYKENTLQRGISNSLEKTLVNEKLRYLSSNIYLTNVSIYYDIYLKIWSLYFYLLELSQKKLFKNVTQYND